MTHDRVEAGNILQFLLGEFRTDYKKRVSNRGKGLTTLRDFSLCKSHTERHALLFLPIPPPNPLTHTRHSHTHSHMHACT